MDENQRIKESIKNLSFSQKVEHIWFYYKWFILFGIIVLGFLIVCLKQCTGKKEPDATVMYAGPVAISSHYTDAVGRAFSDIMSEDYNGNGIKSAELISIQLITDPEASKNTETLQMLGGDGTNEMLFYNQNAAGTAVVYLIDEEIYPTMKEFLTPLDEILDEVPDFALDEYGIRLRDLPCYTETDLRYLPEDAVLCLRSKTKLRYLNPFSDEYYAANASFFRDLVNYQKDSAK